MRQVAGCYLLAAACLCLCGCGSDPAAPPPAQAEANATPENYFQEVAAELGVNFIHRAGTNYFMPDQIGSGVTVFDFDQDGRLDLYFVQNYPGPPADRNRLFHQEADGKFKDVSEGSGLEESGRGMGAIAGDINNDGRPDVVVTEYGATRVFRNAGAGRFEEVENGAGVDNPRWGVPASFIDFDRDGWLDLAVGNYVDYDPTQICRDAHGLQEFCAPGAFPATTTRLWRNVTGTAGAPPKFEDWTVQSGLVRHPGVALGMVCADFTGDGWPDIFCADDGRANRLFVNQQNGTFKEEAAVRGLAYDAMGGTAGNMGVAYADLDGDGLGDLFITHLTEEFHALYRQDRPGLFMDVAGQSGLQQQGWRGTAFGTVAADFNFDGWLDLAFVNGLIRRGPTAGSAGKNVDPWWARYAQRPQLFENTRGKFRDISGSNPAFCGEALVGRSLALADLNNDGAPDLVTGAIGGPVRIHKNVARKQGHWLKLRLVDPARGGRDAIGAEVRFEGGGRRWWGVLQPSTSYLASSEPALNFGLGDLGRVERIEVAWADGDPEIFEVGAVDRVVTFKKGAAR